MVRLHSSARPWRPMRGLAGVRTSERDGLSSSAGLWYIGNDGNETRPLQAAWVDHSDNRICYLSKPGRGAPVCPFRQVVGCCSFSEQMSRILRTPPRVAIGPHDRWWLQASECREEGSWEGYK